MSFVLNDVFISDLPFTTRVSCQHNFWFYFCYIFSKFGGYFSMVMPNFVKPSIFCQFLWKLINFECLQLLHSSIYRVVFGHHWLGPQPPYHPAKPSYNPNKHGCRQDRGCWLQQNDVTLPAACLRPCSLGEDLLASNASASFDWT